MYRGWSCYCEPSLFRACPPAGGTHSSWWVKPGIGSSLSRLYKTKLWILHGGTHVPKVSFDAETVSVECPTATHHRHGWCRCHTTWSVLGLEVKRCFFVVVWFQSKVSPSLPNGFDHLITIVIIFSYGFDIWIHIMHYLYAIFCDCI